LYGFDQTVRRLAFSRVMASEQCVICLEPVSRDMGVTDCSHSFCSHCIQQWVRECSTCPICRQEITRIQLFYRSFFMGDEITVSPKHQQMPVPDDPRSDSDSSDGFISDEIIYEAGPSKPVSDPATGTTWASGHRTSQRLSGRPGTVGPFRSKLTEFRAKQVIRAADRLSAAKIMDDRESGRFIADTARGFGLLRALARTEEAAGDCRLEEE
jgi:hypothetical protein